METAPEFPIPLLPSTRATRVSTTRPAEDASLRALELLGVKFGRALRSGELEMWPTDLARPREIWSEADLYARVPDGFERRRIQHELRRAARR